MTAESPRPKGRNRILTALDAHIQILDVAKDACGIPPAQTAFGITSTVLTTISGTMANKQDYVALGKTCAHVCQALNRGLNGRRLDDLSQSVVEAIEQLTTTVAEIQMNIVARGKQNSVSRALNAKKDKDTIAGWKQDLNGILHIFNTELLLNNHAILLDIRHHAFTGQEGADFQHQPTQSSTPVGELPPPPPRACFGRDELIEKILGFAENLNPIVLIGPGGIGKTSVALAVLHNNRIKERFGDNRRFIRCDQFTASLANFLGRLSKVIGAGVENPEDLTPLRPCLSSKEMILILDNAESILDPQGTDGQEIYGVVEELSQLDNVCLFITSRITTIPPDCKRLDVPPLSMNAAHRTFYRIYDKNERSDHIDEILAQLDFHPLSVTLLATVARQNEWDNNRLVREWKKHQTGILQTEHSKSLAVTIELSLASPMFQQLGPDARELLGVVAFFPQGVDENNLDWLFSTIPNRNTIFDKFCVLSLTYRSNGFITMLAPLRDYLCPKDPRTSPPLCTAKGLYITRLSADLRPTLPGFEDTRWIKSEDANVEHLLDVFTSVDPNSDDTWDGCNGFMTHLYWQKPRQTVLGSKIERLPDDHRPKPRGLFELSHLFGSVGNYIEGKRLLTQALELWRERGDDYWIARSLRFLADVNRMLDLFEEGIQQTREAMGVFERLGHRKGQGVCLLTLARLLLDDEQPGAAEEAVTRAINLMEKGQEYSLCQSHYTLGDIFRSRRERAKAIHHYNAAVRIASQFGWVNRLFWIHRSMAVMFYYEHDFDNTHAHIKQAKLHALDDKYLLGVRMETQAWIWHRQGNHEEAKSEAFCAMEMYEEVGAVKDIEDCRDLLRSIEQAARELFYSDEPDSSADETTLRFLPTDVVCSDPQEP